MEKENHIAGVFPPAAFKRDKNVWNWQPLSSIWRPLAFLPVTLSVGEYHEESKNFSKESVLDSHGYQ